MFVCEPAVTFIVTTTSPETVAPDARSAPAAFLTLWIETDGCVTVATVTVTSADFVGSAIDETVTVAVPDATAVTTQLVGLETTVTTAVLLETHDVPAATSAAEPVSVLVIVVVPCGERLTVVGETVIVTAGFVTVSVAKACFVGSAVEVAVMTVVPALFFAVATPVVAFTVATVVSDDVKVFAVFVFPVTFATKVNVPPTSIVAAGGLIVIAVWPG
jgi:hypothetical protein